MRDDLIRVISEFTGAILNPFDLPDLLDRLTHHAVDVLDAAGAGIMLQDQDDRLGFAAASDPAVVEVEQHQEDVMEGACVEAFQTNQLVVVEDVTRRRDSWASYVDRVLGNDLRAVVGLPMNAFGRTIGVLNIYRREAGPWTSDDLESAQILAAMGAGYIVHASELRAQHDLAEHLQAAIDSRDMIGQAKGIIMARESVSADEAFDILRNISQRQNRKLREVAQLIIEGAANLEV